MKMNMTDDGDEFPAPGRNCSEDGGYRRLMAGRWRLGARQRRRRKRWPRRSR